MTRTQIHLPDDLYARAKRLAAEREISLAELTRRGLEMLLDRYPEPSEDKERWELPVVNGGGLKTPPQQLRDLLGSDEERRSGDS